MGEAKRKRERRAKSVTEWNFANFATVEDRLAILSEPWALPLATQLVEKHGCDCIRCGATMIAPDSTAIAEVIGWTIVPKETDPGGREAVVIILCRQCASLSDHTLEGAGRVALEAAAKIFAHRTGAEFWLAGQMSPSSEEVH